MHSLKDFGLFLFQRNLVFWLFFILEKEESPKLWYDFRIYDEDLLLTFNLFFQLKSAADPTPNVPVRRWRIAWSIVTVRPALRAPREPPVQRVGLFFKFCLELFERFLFVFVLKESWFLIVFHQSQVSYSEWQSKPSFFFLDSFYYLQIFFFLFRENKSKIPS